MSKAKLDTSRLNGVFEKYKGSLKITYIDSREPISLTVQVPLAMYNEYVGLAGLKGKRGKYPISFWKDMEMNERLKPFAQDGNAKTLSCLKTVTAEFDEFGVADGMMNLHVRQRGYREIRSD